MPNRIALTLVPMTTQPGTVKTLRADTIVQRDRNTFEMTDRHPHAMERMKQGCYYSKDKSNQIIFITCAKYNWCKPYSEMLAYEPFPTMQFKTLLYIFL